MTDAQRIYHIAPALDVERAARNGNAPGSFASAGFIHCCYAQQVREVANRFFRGRSNLLLLEIDTARLSCPVVTENRDGGDELFPHVYGELPMSSVLAIRELRCTSEGGFDMPCMVKE
jgi:uncharacterized protein (DUF952 family)